MNILILASQHGDEHSGEKLYAYIENSRTELLPFVSFLIGNPKARQQNVRYIESDLNRSYNGENHTFEERRAQVVLKRIATNGYDLVLDMHTTVCDQSPCLIVASVNPQNEQFLRATSTEHIIEIEEDTVKTALNGVCPQAISVEINHIVTDAVLDQICDDIQRYIDKAAYKADKYVYEAGLLKKDEVSADEFKELRNFTLSNKGYYPVLVGESSYQKHGYDYLGFKAYNRRKFKV